jgi:phospholipid transport system substrate-binding protein
MRIAIVKLSVFLALAAAVQCSVARDQTPDAMLRAAAADVMSIIGPDGEALAQAVEFEQNRALPLFDFARMTRLALARNWNLASAEQQTQLVEEFRTLFARTYAAALLHCRGGDLEFKPVRLSAGDTAARVRAEASRLGGDRLSIDYDLEMTQGGWKVFDLKVGGVSVIATFRESFAQAVRDGGVDALIKQLSDRNRQADLADTPDQMRFSDRWRMMFAMFRSALQGRR